MAYMLCLEGWTGLSGEACLQMSSECGMAQGTKMFCIVMMHVLSMYLKLLYNKPLLGLKKSYFSVHFVYIVWDFCNIIIDLAEQSLELLKTFMVDLLHCIHVVKDHWRASHGSGKASVVKMSVVSSVRLLSFEFRSLSYIVCCFFAQDQVFITNCQQLSTP